MYMTNAKGGAMSGFRSDEIGFEPFDPQVHQRGVKLYTLRLDPSAKTGLSPEVAPVSYESAKTSPWQYVVSKQEKQLTEKPSKPQSPNRVSWLKRLAQSFKDFVQGKADPDTEGPQERKEADWQVQPFHSDWGTSEGDWSFSAEDGNAILDKGGWSLYKQVHLACDTSGGQTPEKKGAYKYPAAKLVNGKPTYFFRAAATVNAGLSGGARSADLPTAVNERIAQTVAKIYKAFDRDPDTVSAGKAYNVKRFVTLDDGRVIFIGGPPQGSGSATPGGAGETPTESAGSIEDMARYLHEDAAAFESELTPLIQNFVEDSGGQMYGLDHRLKTEQSITSKINRDVAEDGAPPEMAALGISDLVRYTALFDAGDLVDKANELQGKLEEAGWNQYDHKWKNFFTSSGAYRGYNTVYENDQGQRFEFQFHTPESMEIKDKAHALYERFREMPRSPERTAMEERCVALWQDFQPPDNWTDLRGVAIE
jgi:hypothetical protein